MSLKYNNTEISSVIFNGAEQMSLRFNGTACFGKRFSLTKNTSSGVSFSISRTSSPNQHAPTGSVETGNTIYYGDQITISVSADTGYSQPILYVDTGSGMTQRSSPYSFTVTGNVTFYGTATGDWQTVWTGSQTFTESGSFTVPGLSSGGNAQVTASVEFGAWILDPHNGEILEETTFLGSGNRQPLPATIGGYSSYVSITKSGNTIYFTFEEATEVTKGYTLYEIPVSITFTEVRGKA